MIPFVVFFSWLLLLLRFCPRDLSALHASLVRPFEFTCGVLRICSVCCTHAWFVFGVAGKQYALAILGGEPPVHNGVIGALPRPFGGLPTAQCIEGIRRSAVIGLRRPLWRPLASAEEGADTLSADQSVSAGGVTLAKRAVSEVWVGTPDYPTRLFFYISLSALSRPMSKECVYLAVDVSAPMGAYLAEAVEALTEMVSDKVLWHAQDALGLAFLGGATNNTLAAELGGYEGIAEMHALAPVGSNGFEAIGALQKLRSDHAHASDIGGRSSSSFDVIDAIVVAVDSIEKYCEKHKYAKRILLVTAGVDLRTDDDGLPEEVVVKLKDAQIRVDFYGSGGGLSLLEDEEGTSLSERSAHTRHFLRTLSSQLGRPADALDGEPANRQGHFQLVPLERAHAQELTLAPPPRKNTTAYRGAFTIGDTKLPVISYRQAPHTRLKLWAQNVAQQGGGRRTHVSHTHVCANATLGSHTWVFSHLSMRVLVAKLVEVKEGGGVSHLSESQGLRLFRALFFSFITLPCSPPPLTSRKTVKASAWPKWNSVSKGAIADEGARAASLGEGGSASASSAAAAAGIDTTMTETRCFRQADPNTEVAPDLRLKVPSVFSHTLPMPPIRHTPLPIRHTRPIRFHVCHMPILCVTRQFSVSHANSLSLRGAPLRKGPGADERRRREALQARR